MFTEKGIFYLNSKLKPFLSDSILKNTLWNILVLLGFYVFFNVFAVIKLLDYAHEELDKKIMHEIEHIDIFVDFDSDSLIFHNTLEFNEPDFLEITPNAYFLQIYDKYEKILFQSKNLNEIGNLPIPKKKLDSDIFFDNGKLNNFDLRFIYKKLDSGEDAVIQLATPRTSILSLAGEYGVFLTFSFPFVFLLILIISFFLSKRAYRNLNKIINLADEISAQNISRRIEFSASPGDVLAKLRDTLNDLFGRLENQINQISEFTNNASHQLMSPLTAIKTELEYLLKKERNQSEYIETLSVLKEQTDRMIKIVKTLLILAKESGESKEFNNVFSLNKLVDTEIKPRFNVNINYDIEENLYLRGHLDYFSMVLQNLLDNAIKYSNESAIVSLFACQKDDSIEIRIEDKGIGIPDDEKNKVFDRFYRGSNSVSHRGFGLGLNLTMVIVKQMQGTIKIENNSPRGSVFAITLPVVPIS
jgi:signal transduction histidine kinase